MTQLVKFTVFGKPQQRGSKQAGVRYGPDGKPITKDGRVLTFAKDDNAKSKDWMQMVTSAAASSFRGELLSGPIVLTARFYFARPSSHFVKAGLNPNKDKAPDYHTQTPDLSKLMRAIEDGLTGVVYRDDRQVVRYGMTTGKYWTTEQSRAEIEIMQLDPVIVKPTEAQTA